MEVSAANEHLVFEARPPQAKGIIGDNPSLSAGIGKANYQEVIKSPSALRLRAFCIFALTAFTPFYRGSSLNKSLNTPHVDQCVQGIVTREYLLTLYAKATLFLPRAKEYF